MLRLVLGSILLTMLARAFWRVVEGIVEGLTGRGPQGPRSSVPQRGVPMARDPVCGTFVLPDNALSLVERGSRVFFCSETCRDKYRARTA
jgi:YHS domain-containing protein